MSFVLLGILNSQASGEVVVPYRFQTLGGGGSEVGQQIVVDNSYNSYTTAQTNATDSSLVKYDFEGTVQWQRQLAGSGNNDQPYGIALDSSSNVYFTGRTNSVGSGGLDILIAKYDNSGTLQWQRAFGGGSDENGFEIGLDSNDNLYVIGSTKSAGTGTQSYILSKWDSSGTIQWQRVLGGSGAESEPRLAIDSSGNIYGTGYTNTSGFGNLDMNVFKYDSSGNLQWQRTFGGSGNDVATGIAVDSADNVYVTGYSNSSPADGEDMVLAKFNSSGTLQWQRIVGLGGSEVALDVTVDSLDNIYVSGRHSQNSQGSNDAAILKYDSSGVIQWQRMIGGADEDYPYGIATDPAGNVYTIGFTRTTGAGGNDQFLTVIPADGSLTGTYVLDGANMVYKASSLTDQAGGMSAATSSLTNSTSSLTVAFGNLTSSTTTYTQHLVNL